MNDTDDRLRALFAADLPQARDPVFQARILAALALRRFLRDMALLAATSLAGAASLAILWPILAPALARLSEPLAPAAVALVVVISILGFALGYDTQGSGADAVRD